jgi:hypothetical protein
MSLMSPERDLIQHLLGAVAAAESVYGQWSGNGASNAHVPKEALDGVIRRWSQLQRLDELQPFGLQRLAAHFRELAACRQLLDRYADPDSPHGPGSVTIAGKREVTGRVNPCLAELRAAVLGMLGEAAGG